MNLDKISSVIYGNDKKVFSAGESSDIGGIVRVRNEFTECGENAFEWVTRFENISNRNSERLSFINGMDWLFETDEKTLVYESLKGDSCGGESFLPIKEIIKAGQPLEKEPFGGRSSNTTAFPFFDLKAGNKSLICAIGWTGQWVLRISKEDGGFRISVGLRDADFYLEPGETARSPRVLVMFGDSDVEKLRRDFRHLMLMKYSPRAVDGEKFRVPVALQNFDRFYWNDTLIDGEHWATEKKQLEGVALAAKCGMDSYWIDAGWFVGGFIHQGVGNYRYETGFPNGLKKIADSIHAHGMKFILWFEPERPYLGTDTAERWRNCLLADNPESDHRLLDYSAPGVIDWVYEKISAVIEENGVDVYRQDFNTDPLWYWRKKDEKTEDRKGMTEMKHVTAMYWLWDSLKKRFPNLVIDNCSSGGRRIDLETCMRAVPLWRSDTGCSASSESKPSHIWNQNQTLSLARYLPYQSIASWLPDANEFRSAATMGIACNFDVFNPEFSFETAKNAADEVHSLQRMWEGDFYGLTEPTLSPEAWAGYQLHHENEGFCAFFRRSGETDTHTFTVNALKPNAKYSVTVSDELYKKTEKTLTGSELKIFCENVKISGKNNSLLVVYREK